MLERQKYFNLYTNFDRWIEMIKSFDPEETLGFVFAFYHYQRFVSWFHGEVEEEVYESVASERDLISSQLLQSDNKDNKLMLKFRSEFLDSLVCDDERKPLMDILYHQLKIRKFELIFIYKLKNLPGIKKWIGTDFYYLERLDKREVLYFTKSGVVTLHSTFLSINESAPSLEFSEQSIEEYLNMIELLGNAENGEVDDMDYFSMS